MTTDLGAVWPGLLVLTVLFALGVLVLDRTEDLGLAAAIAVDLALLAGLVALVLLLFPDL